jgi:TatD DNase family protein
LGGVFHCFAGDLDTAKAAVDLNFDLAVGGVLTYKTANGLREIIAAVRESGGGTLERFID